MGGKRTLLREPLYLVRTLRQAEPMEWSKCAYPAVLAGGLLLASCGAPHDEPTPELVQSASDGDAYFGVPLSVERGDVNCSISATTPTVLAIGETGNRVDAAISKARCDSDPPVPGDNLALEVELFECLDRERIKLGSVDGQISYELISVGKGSGPPGIDPDPERATRAVFRITPQQRGRALTFRLTSPSSDCRATVTIPPMHVDALDAWEQDNFRSFQAANPDYYRRATP
jgi:hypothetical protein